MLDRSPSDTKAALTSLRVEGFTESVIREMTRLARASFHPSVAPHNGSRFSRAATGGVG